MTCSGPGMRAATGLTAAEGRGNKLDSTLDGSCNFLPVCLNKTCALDENGTWTHGGLRARLERTLRRKGATELRRSLNRWSKSILFCTISIDKAGELESES